MGPAMDHQIAWYLFNAVIEASEFWILIRSSGISFNPNCERLTPVKIGGDGRILEWSDERLGRLSPDTGICRIFTASFPQTSITGMIHLNIWKQLPG